MWTTQIFCKLSFKLGIYQAYKLRQIMKGHYLVWVIGFENNILFPFSKIHSSCKVDIMQDTLEAVPFLPPTPEPRSKREFHSTFEPFDPCTPTGRYDKIHQRLYHFYHPHQNLDQKGNFIHHLNHSIYVLQQGDIIILMLQLEHHMNQKQILAMQRYINVTQTM